MPIVLLPRADNLVKHVIEPTLKYLDHSFYSYEATMLLLGTAAHESCLGRYLTQAMPEGKPSVAMGPYQMEQATYESLWQDYLYFRPVLASQLKALKVSGIAGWQQMTGNWYYATAMARVKYLIAEPPLPVYDPKAPTQEFLVKLADYWGKHYQTQDDPKKRELFVKHYCRYIVA